MNFLVAHLCVQSCASYKRLEKPQQNCNQGTRDKRSRLEYQKLKLQGFQFLRKWLGCVSNLCVIENIFKGNIFVLHL